MKPKTMILMVVAVGCGLVASYMTSRLIAERGAAVTASSDARETVLVAKVKVPAYTVLKEPEKWFVEKEVAADSIPKTALRSLDKLRGKKVSRTIAEDTYVGSEDLVDPTTDGLAARLPPGMRAVGLRVNPESIAGGFVLPNSRVDVLLTVKVGEGGNALTILQDILVLAVDMKDSRDPTSDPRTMLGQTVTLAVRPEEAEVLRLAGGVGELSLMLRGIGDNEKIKSNGRGIRDFSKLIAALSEERNKQDGGQQGGPEPKEGPTLPPLKKGPGQIVEEKPEDDRIKHTMTLRNGDQTTRAVFVREKEKDWDGGDGRGKPEDKAAPPKEVKPAPEKPQEDKPQPQPQPDAGKRPAQRNG
jgi:pilus assembly protein CpaB